MKHPFLILGFIGTILLLTLVVIPVSADITSISPTSGNRGDSVTITIKGTGFDLPSSSSYKYVRLYYDSDTTNITSSSITSKSSTKIVAKFTLGSTKTKGSWYVVVVNDDDSEYMSSSAFTISDDMTLTSISPTYAKTNDDDVSFTLVGTGLTDVEQVYLYNKNYDNVTTTDITASSSSVTGTFDLSDIDEATYKVCVMDSLDIRKCSSSVTFDVDTDAVGEIDISSSPTGASVYVDSTYVGTTPYAMTDVSVGSHTVKVSKTGYNDWSNIVKVTDGGTNTVAADLSVVETTVITTVPTSAPTTIKTLLKVTTVKVPTTYPKTTTTTPASPVEGAVILGAIGLGIVVLHRKQ